MRSYTVYGVKDGVEDYVTVVHSADEGKQVHQQMRAGGFYDTIRVRDCLGGLQFESSLKNLAKVG
jgi:hypothetical protein